MDCDKESCIKEKLKNEIYEKDNINSFIRFIIYAS